MSVVLSDKPEVEGLQRTQPPVAFFKRVDMVVDVRDVLVDDLSLYLDQAGGILRSRKAKSHPAPVFQRDTSEDSIIARWQHFSREVSTRLF
ncbi:MAG TPA: hypothetical protein VGA84_02250 [Thermoanaerobaculia bacterium]